MTEPKADLHCHSIHSDGSLTPRQLLQMAKDNGLSGLSITDHDTVGAYPAVLEQASEFGISVISGVEFTAAVQHTSVHILGYAFDPYSPAIQALCSLHRKRREERNAAILDLLNAKGFALDASDLPPTSEHGSIGRPHIAAAMVRKGYVTSIGDAFKKFLREGACCYTPGPRFSVEDTIQTIREGGGLAVIAHPHLVTDDKIIKHLLSLDFDGMECYYAFFSLDRCQRWLDIANSKGWLITGGSDFHGDAKPTIALGSSWTKEDSFNKLLNHFRRHNLA